jgi:regulator of protease activity HflC (stomatin/prohibitin superfamily)
MLHQQEKLHVISSAKPSVPTPLYPASKQNESPPLPSQGTGTVPMYALQSNVLNPLTQPASQSIIGSLTLDDVITKSTLYHPDPLKLAENIRAVFNKNVSKSCFDTSLIRGVWLNPGEFLLGHRNKTPELATFDKSRNIAVTWPNPLGVVTEYLLNKNGHPFKQSDLFFGAFGTYVLNVPPGKLALAKSGNQPLIFSPGPHVIHDTMFSFDPAKGLVDQSSPWISHETLTILRVPAGKIAKIWIGSVPELLESRPEPYVFNTPLFSLQLHSTSPKDYFFDATDNFIGHGSLKRLMPRTGEIAITYNNGTLEVIQPKLDSKPTYIDSASHEFVSFLSTAVQNLEFPSAETKSRRLKDNPKATTDELTYELFTTRDSLKVGVKLYVAYSIVDAMLALTKLRDLKGILDHIESCATVDMGMAIQQCTSQEFLNSYQTKPAKNESPYYKDLQSVMMTPSQDEPQSIQDKVKKKLSKDLADFGIELVRLNFETPKMMDLDIAKKMSEQSLRTAEASSQEAVLEQNFRIAARKAEQEATTRRIAQDQLNQAKISQAQAELDAAKLSAEASLIKADADKKSAVLRGQQYTENPKLFELEMYKIQMENLAKAQFIPPQLSQLLTQGVFNSPYTLFGGGMLGQGAMPKESPALPAPKM